MLRRRLYTMPFLIIFLLVILPVYIHQAAGQVTGMANDRFFSIQQNSTSSLEAFGDTLWTGPGLNYRVENGTDWQVPVRADSVFEGRGRAFSLALGENRVLAGLGFTSQRNGGSVQTAMGYYLSPDGGEMWRFLPFPLDEPADPELCDPGEDRDQPDCDISFTYGGAEYRRLRITVPEQSPPFEVDFAGDTMLSVNWASGLLRSRDGGGNWERLILPPSTETELTPDNEYTWNSRSRTGESINRYDPRTDNNLLAFGLLIDSSGRVWTGTAAGINISDNALHARSDSISWRRIPFADEEDGLMGGWIVAIREEPGTGRVWLTNWASDPENRDRFGLVSTVDSGETFRHHLEDVRVNDVAFFQGKVFAAADNGLYRTADNGESWEKISPLRSPNTFIKDNARYLSAAATNSNIWIGTSDGLAFSSDGGETWNITRVDFPLRGGNIYQQDAPDTEAYAYPNPFSPNRHNIARIKFEVRQQSRVQIRIFDFSMNLIRNLDNRELSPGTYEAAWDGRDEYGRKVHNGPVFYVIEEGGRQIHGKILVLD